MTEFEGETATAAYVKHQVQVVGAIDGIENNKRKSIYANMAIAITDVEIKADANEASGTVGKLFEGCIATVVEKTDVWAKISSGEATGFVKCEVLCFDEEARDYAEGKAEVTAVANSNVGIFSSNLNDAQKVATFNEGDSVSLVGVMGDRYIVKLEDGTEGYVLQSGITVDFGLEYGKTTAQIEADEEAARKAAEEAAAAAAEEARRIAELEEANNRLWEAHLSDGLDVTYEAAYAASQEEIWAMACVIYWESGNQPYAGKLAVANCIMNRVRSGYYPDNIIDVIESPYQFTVLSNHGDNWPDRFAYIYENCYQSDECLAAAIEAINGVNNIGYYNSFRALWSVPDLSIYDDYVIIQDHIFR